MMIQTTPARRTPPVRRAARPFPSLFGHAALTASLGATLSCGSSPMSPAPPPPTPNAPPIIRGIEIEPARIELNEDVTVRATVEDAETPVESLIYEWSADGGTFTGEGASVTWRPPADAGTPASFTLRLTVRERYGPPNATGGQAEHRVTGESPPVRVHDSSRELREMSLRFLELFADSNRSPDECVEEFSDSCRGKQSEREDIEDNRRYYEIRSASFDFDDLEIEPDRMFARMFVDCEFRSRYRRCPPEDPSCVVGSVEEVRGVCRLTAIYENDRWWLCDSNFALEDFSVTVPLRFFGGR